MNESIGKTLLKAFSIAIGATVCLVIAIALIISKVPEESQGLYLGVTFIVFLTAIFVPTIKMSMRRRKELLDIEIKHKTGEVSEEDYQKVQSNQNKRYIAIFILIVVIFILKIISANM